MDWMLRMFNGKEFHCLDAQNENDLSPKVLVRTFGITKILSSADDLSCLDGVYMVRSWPKYSGAEPEM